MSAPRTPGFACCPAGPGESVNARRETVFTVGPGGMLSVAGGKLTTYRRIALEALGRVRSELGIHRLEGRPWPLPDAPPGPVAPLSVRLPPESAAHLVHLYGSRADDVLRPALDDPSLLEPLHPGGPDIAAQARYAVSSEWASTADDVVWRRTTVGWRGLDGAAVRDRIDAATDSGPSAVAPA